MSSIEAQIKRIVDKIYAEANKSYIFTTYTGDAMYVTLMLCRRDYLKYKFLDKCVTSIDSNDDSSNLFYTLHLMLPTIVTTKAITTGDCLKWFDAVMMCSKEIKEMKDGTTKSRIKTFVSFVRKMFVNDSLNPIDMDDITKHFTIYPKFFTIIDPNETDDD